MTPLGQPQWAARRCELSGLHEGEGPCLPFKLSAVLHGVQLIIINELSEPMQPRNFVNVCSAYVLFFFDVVDVAY